MIRFQAVTKRYSDNDWSLPPLSFEIAAGAWATLSGPAGCGKTTVISLLAGHESPTQGEIHLNDASLGKLSRAARARLRCQMGLIPQTPCFIEDRSVLDNVALPLILTGVGGAERRSRAQLALDKVGLKPLIHCRTDALSHSARQRLAVARAVINRPTLILADEPLTGLSGTEAEQVLNLLLSFQRGGVTVVVGWPTPLDLPAVAGQVISLPATAPAAVVDAS